jgi:hypothetical protein
MRVNLCYRLMIPCGTLPVRLATSGVMERQECMVAGPVGLFGTFCKAQERPLTGMGQGMARMGRGLNRITDVEVLQGY